MTKTWKALALGLTVASIATARAANDTGVTVAQINGTWATPAGEFKIWALDYHRLRVEFWSLPNTKENLVRRQTPATVTALQ
jgi:hypothetical protein